MTLNISIPSATEELRPKITVIGVGGAGGNAVNNMIEAQLEGVEFLVANTDGQALAASLAPRKIQLGREHTEGLGAGSKPEIGRLAAEESLEEIMAELADSHMVFITAGMGGGTGTGAAPVIARAAREHGILTVGVVTKPFDFEGSPRMRLANEGIEELQAYVDTLIIIPNQNLFRLANERTTFTDAFSMADNVLHQGVSGVTDLMIKPGMVNLDFADIRSVMTEMGKAMMGTGEASGEGRATNAAESAIHNPLLDETTLQGAQALLINITGGSDMTLFEADEAANHIRKEVDSDAIIIFGAIIDEKMEGVMRVSVVATGMEAGSQTARPPFHHRMADAISTATEKATESDPAPFYLTRRKEGVVESVIEPAIGINTAQNATPEAVTAPEVETTATAATETESSDRGFASLLTASSLPAADQVEVMGQADDHINPENMDVSATEDDENQLSMMAISETKPDSESGSVSGSETETMSAQDEMETHKTDASLPAETDEETITTADALAQRENPADEEPFTLGKTVDIPADEQPQQAESTSLMRHITRMFSSKPVEAKPEQSEQEDATVEVLPTQKIEPILNWAEEPKAPAPEATEDHLAPASHDQIHLKEDTKEPELDMNNQNSEFDLEIPAFLRRQAN
jgi:cell division protein FtsZ